MVQNSPKIAERNKKVTGSLREMKLVPDSGKITKVFLALLKMFGKVGGVG